MKLRSLLTVSLVTLTLSGCVFVHKSSRANIHENKDLFLQDDGIDTLIVNAEAGDLWIKGDDDATTITVKAEVYTDDSDNYELSLEKHGRRAVLTAEHHGSGFYVGNSPRIHLQVTVPSHLMLDVTDGSGRMDIENIKQDVRIKDGSGDIKVEFVTGNLEIDDGSGSLYAMEVGGDVNIEDGSGDITVEQVGGDLMMDDGSGSIRASHIGGHVTVDDGSGDINIRHAKGLTVLDEGSGSLNIHDVQGELNING